MGRWTDIATWAGPIPNCGPGNMTGHMGVVIHTAEGSYAGTDSWQRNPAADVGSHFLTAKDGRVEQLVDTDIRSWCQSAGNDQWISIENEGFGSRGESLSPQQVENCARILAKANQLYGIPLVVSNSPSTRGLGWHGMGGSAWGGHFDCPGPAIKAQLPAIVARAAQILNGNTGDTEGDDQMKTMLVMLKGGDGAVWLSNGLTRYHVGDHTTTDLTTGGEAVLRDVRYVSGAQQLGSLISDTITVVGDLDAFGAEVPADLAARLGGVTSGNAPTQEQVNTAVLAVMLDPRVQKGIGDAIASHLHVS